MVGLLRGCADRGGGWGSSRRRCGGFVSRVGLDVEGMAGRMIDDVPDKLTFCGHSCVATHDEVVMTS